MFYLLFIILGGIWGSFSNVCIYRLPENQGIIAGELQLLSGSFSDTTNDRMQDPKTIRGAAPQK